MDASRMRSNTYPPGGSDMRLVADRGYSTLSDIHPFPLAIRLLLGARVATLLSVQFYK